MDRRKFIKNIGFLSCFPFINITTNKKCSVQSFEETSPNETVKSLDIKEDYYSKNIELIIIKIDKWFDFRNIRTNYMIHCKGRNEKIGFILETRSDLNKIKPLVGDYMEKTRHYGSDGLLILGIPYEDYHILITKKSNYKKRYNFILQGYYRI